MKFQDYVGADVADRVHHEGDGWHTLLIERGNQKVPPTVALTNAWEHASAGAALGAIHPDILRAMFERTHADIPEEKWRLMEAAGLDIGPGQTRTTYGEAEAAENKTFTEYCREYRPKLYAALND